MRRVLLGLIIGLVAAAVLAGLWFAGSPGEARARRLDAKRVADLRDLSYATSRFRTKHDRLPASLDELSKDQEERLRLQDPTSAEPYEYHVLSSTTYELCARFERASAEDAGEAGGAAWSHAAGRHCFRREAAPEKK